MIRKVIIDIIVCFFLKYITKNNIIDYLVWFFRIM